MGLQPITVIVYSESGGTFKTTTTANLAIALHRMGLDVCVIDLDPQEGNLTSLFDLGDDRHDEQADNIVKHILEMPDGDFQDLIQTSREGIDIIPSHSMLGNFTSNLERKLMFEQGMGTDGDDERRYKLLHNLLWQEQALHEQYDAILTDPNARAEDLLYNAIYAMRTLVAPVKPAGKGSLSLDGLDDLLSNMEAELGIQVGVSAVVPNAVGQTNAHQEYEREFRETDEYPTPVVIGDRESMMDEMWEARASAFTVVEDRWKTFEDDDGNRVSIPGERGIRENEIETLAKLYELAAFVATNTFDHNIDHELVLDITDRDSRSITVQPDATREVTQT